eukprot:TRINITY_DN21277_c0_g1_i1.p1 TRINITY_DN21277_c0_g1~~TRINITY_DN21277_c0_g1_i1.p1  ORF type:complete len:313 (-),score=26.19 TRINITY_DN21277_c0_g1_i1:461-1318(-)
MPTFRDIASKPCASFTCSTTPSDAASSDRDFVVSALREASFEGRLEIFADSEDELLPTSPSKSARRRMRRRRQRDALKALSEQRTYEPQFFRAEARSVVTLNDLGLIPTEPNAAEPGLCPDVLHMTASSGMTRTASKASMPPTLHIAGLHKTSMPPAAPEVSPSTGSATGAHAVLTTSLSRAYPVRDDASAGKTPESHESFESCRHVPLQLPSLADVSTQFPCRGPVNLPVSGQVTFADSMARGSLPNVPSMHTLRLFFGDGTLALSRADLVARLEASVPEVYED